MSNFKVGDKVVCLLNGEGVVGWIEADVEESVYPLWVDFNSGAREQYTLNGYMLEDNKFQCLFPKGTVITPPIVPAPEFVNGQLVMVRDFDHEYYVLAVYNYTNGSIHNARVLGTESLNWNQCRHLTLDEKNELLIRLENS